MHCTARLAYEALLVTEENRDKMLLDWALTDSPAGSLLGLVAVRERDMGKVVAVLSPEDFERQYAPLPEEPPAEEPEPETEPPA